MLTFTLGCAVLIAAGGFIAWVAGEWVGHARESVALFAAHVAVALALGVGDLLPAPDAIQYDRIARWHLDYWSGELTYGPNDPPGKSGYPIMLATLYKLLGGRHMIFGALWNATLATLAFMLLARTCQLVGWGKASRTVVLLGFLPAFLLWSGLSLREAGVWFLTAMILFGGASYIAGRAPTAVIAITLGAGGLSAFRGSLSAIVVGGVVVGVFLSRKKATPLATAMMGIAALGLVFYALQKGLANSLTDQTQLNASRSELSRSGSGFATASYQGPMSAIVALPITVPRILFGPYPTAWASIGVYGPLIWVVWIWLLWNAVQGFKSQRASRARWLWVPPALMLTIILAITSGNWGTMARIREQVSLCLVPLAAIWWCDRRQRHAEALRAMGNRRRRKVQQYDRHLSRARSPRHPTPTSGRHGGTW